MQFKADTRKNYIASLIDTFAANKNSFVMPLLGSSIKVEVAHLAHACHDLTVNAVHFEQDFLPAQALITQQTVARGLHVAAYYLAFELERRTGTVEPLPFPLHYMLTIDALRLPRETEGRLVRSGLMFVGDVASASPARLRSALRNGNLVNLVTERMVCRGFLETPTAPWPSDTPDALTPEVVIQELDHPMLAVGIEQLGLRPAKTRRLHEAGFATLGALARASHSDLIRIGNIGQSSLDAIDDALAGVGLSVGCLWIATHMGPYQTRG